MSHPRKSPCYYTFEEWKEIIEDWRKSGYSKYAYCIQKNLCPPTFNKWHKKISSSLASQSSLDVIQNSRPLSLKELFIPLTVAPSEAPLDTSFSNQKMEIIFAQGHRLCLEGPFDWKELELWLTPLLTKQEEE